METERTYWHWAMARRISRRKFLRTGAAAGLGVAAGLQVLGCSSSQPQQSTPTQAGQTPQAGQPKTGGILKVGYQAHSGYLFPGYSQQGWDMNFFFIYGDALVHTASDGSADPEASLAESWKKEDDTTFSFKLRQGIKFHDGTDYDAQAHKAYIELLLDKNLWKSYGYRAQIESIKQMEVVDKYTLRMNLSRIDPALLASLGSPGGIPVSPTAVEKLGGDIVTKPAMTGPFMAKSFVAGGEWVFEKNPNYWRKGLPYLDGITFLEIPDDRVRAASVQSGNVDIVFFSVPGDYSEALKKDPNLVTSDTTTGPTLMNINHALPPADNLQIRQAFASCIDKEAILKVVSSNIGQVAKGGIIPPGTWGFTDVSDVDYKFDLDKARQYIKDSGLKTPVSLKLITSETPSDRVPMATLIRGWLVDAGFDVQFDVVASSEYQRRMLDEGSYHLATTSIPARADPGSNFASYSTSTGYYNPGRKSQDPLQKQLDDLVKTGAATYDQAARKKAYDQIQRIHAQSVLAHIPLVYRVYTVAYRKNVKGTENMWNKATGSFRPQFFWKE